MKEKNVIRRISHQNMGKQIFLDANAFIDILESRGHLEIKDLAGNFLYLSALTLHIYFYTYKLKLPSNSLLLLKTQFTFVDLTSDIAQKALSGPTDDYEDNIQLHSAVNAKTDIFITRDKKLLSLGFFGMCRISPSINE